MSIRLAAASGLLLVSAAALAAADPRAGSDAGPFPPRADPILNGPAPPLIAPSFSTAESNATLTQPMDAATIAALTREADAKRIEAAIAETDLDRADRIARERQERLAVAPQPVAPGAWNGETDPRLR